MTYLLLSTLSILPNCMSTLYKQRTQHNANTRCVLNRNTHVCVIVWNVDFDNTQTRELTLARALRAAECGSVVVARDSPLKHLLLIVDWYQAAHISFDAIRRTVRLDGLQHIHWLMLPPRTTPDTKKIWTHTLARTGMTLFRMLPLSHV